MVKRKKKIHVKFKRTLKFRLFPTENQKTIFFRNFGIRRWFYNRTRDYIEEHHRKFDFRSKKDGYGTGFMDVRNAIRNQITRKYDIPDWCNESICPRIITGAIQDCFKSYVSAYKLRDLGYVTHFDIHYKTKKDNNQSLYIEKSCFGKKSNEYLTPKEYFAHEPLIAKRRTGRCLYSKLSCMPLINGPDGHDCRIIYEKASKKFYICLMKKDSFVGETQIDDKLISLDSGIRTFQTGYSPSNQVLKYGNCTKYRLIRILCKQDLFRRLSSKTNSCRMNRQYWKGFFKLSRKIKGLVTELHWKTIKHLVDNYRMIILGEFNVQSILKSRKITRLTKRIMCVQSHYKFRERLAYKCKTRGIHFVTQDESYTSMTCCNCGSLDRKLGGREIYKCSSCGIELDRDYNGAINILIKYLMKVNGTSLGCLKELDTNK